MQEHAREHEKADADLEHFEDAECKGLTASQRNTCPLMGYLSDVRDVEGGVRIRFADQSRASAAVPRMRCHYAYARVHGFTNSPDCALYIRGVDIKPTSDPQAIDIVSGDPNTTAEIRKRARAIAVDHTDTP